jgi:phosphatidylglycerophosphate synthase
MSSFQPITARETEPMTDRLTRWTEQHALLMGMAIVSAWLEHSPLLLAAMAAASFCALLVRNRGHFTPAGAFGLANSLTLTRVVGTLALLLAPGLDPGWQSGAVLLLVCVDGVDGWAARRFDTASTFGQVFDHESDALLLLTVCLLLLASGRVGSWILLPGALRYGYVLLSRQAQPLQQTTPGNHFIRLIGVTTTLGLAVCWLPAIPTPIASSLAAGLTLALTGSFVFSTWRLYRPASAG